MPVVTLDDHFIGVVQAVRPGELGIDTGRVHAEPINVPCEDVRVIDDGYIVLRLAFPALEDLHPVVAGAADDDAAGAASPEG